MHYWRFLIPVLAVLGSVASFTERSSIDGRKRCAIRKELTRAGPDQRFTIAERGYTSKSLEFDRERLDTRARVSHSNRVSADRRISREIHPSEIGHQNRRETRRNGDDGYRSVRHRADSHQEALYRQSHNSEDTKNHVRNLRNSLSRDRTLPVHKRDTERAERRTRTDLRTDNQFRVRRNDEVLQRDIIDVFRRVENGRAKPSRYSDSTRQISRRTRDTRNTERILGTQGQNKERVSPERQTRRESRNSRDTTFRNNRQDIRADRVLSARQNRDITASEESLTRRTLTLLTSETIRDIRRRPVSARATPENTRSTDILTSRQVRLDDSRSNVKDAEERRIRTRMTSSDSWNARDARNDIDQRIRSSERLSRQIRIVESREDLRERRVRTRQTPGNTRLMSNRLDERIRNSVSRGGERKYNAERVADLHDGRRESPERHIERARSASESRTNRAHRLDGRAENRVATRATVRTRSEDPFVIGTLTSSRHTLLRQTKAARDSSKQGSDINMDSDQLLRGSRSNRLETNETETRSPKNHRFRPETEIRDTSRIVRKDQPNKAQEYSEKHIGGASMMSGLTTMAFYSLQGIYVCVLLYQMTKGKSDKSTKFGFLSWPSSPGKLIKSE